MDAEQRKFANEPLAQDVRFPAPPTLPTIAEK
jgi:hypothetical protein